jgi:DNA-binding response OmpR family regulator
MRREVLIVEDDYDIAHLIQMQLNDINCNSHIINNGQTAIEHLRETTHYDLLILDIMLPDYNGLDICREVRSQNQQIPILILTAKSSEFDRVLGLEKGADDYLTKPFSFMELSARVKALLRRTEVNASYLSDACKEQLVFGDLSINIPARTVTLTNKEIDLTAREFDLLYYFAQHPRQVFTRSQLLEKVWGYAHDGYEHTVNTHINRLRNKIEPEHPVYITTVWGVGYQFRHSNEARVFNERDKLSVLN